jgi:cyanophycinase-like exopeptidase
MTDSVASLAARIVAASVFALAGSPASAAADYQYFVSGNPADVTTRTSALIVMQGGGTDVDANFRRMGEKSGGGDFVVLRASQADDYNDYILALCRCDSVETIVFANREAAYDPFVIDKIRNAEALFIAGGDQSRYVRFWKDTPVADAIDFVASKPAPIGGTSAGMAILGQYSYSALTDDSLTSANALADPYHPDLTLETSFLKLAAMEGLITDQHLIEENRIGRTVTLLARLVADGVTGRGRAIAADRETALHIDPASGDVTVHATADHATPYAYFLETAAPATVCAPGQPLSIAGIRVYRVAPENSFNLRSWTGTGGIGYTLSVRAGILQSSRAGAY